MQFKDLSFWGIFKLIVIFEVAIPLVISPFIFTYYLVRPDRFSFNFDWSVKAMGMNVKTTPHSANIIIVILIGLFLAIISMLIQSGILNFLGQKTLLGKIQIGRLSSPNK